MQELKIEYIVKSDLATCFNEISKKEYFKEALEETNRNFKIVTPDVSNEQFSLGHKEKIEYSTLNGYLSGISTMTISEYVHPHRMTEHWEGGIFEYLVFHQFLEKEGDHVLVTYEIEYETKIKFLKNYIEQKKISPFIKTFAEIRGRDIRSVLNEVEKKNGQDVFLMNSQDDFLDEVF